MRFIANRLNGKHLRDLVLEASARDDIDQVYAAIAYGCSSSDETLDLIGSSVKNKLRLDLWMRYDETVPVSIELLKRLLKHQKQNIFTSFVPDRFHPKVIWWKGFGAYVGSANHTDYGWMTNIEAGVFIEEDELISNGMAVELDGFFDYLKNLDKAIPISADYITEMERLQRLKVFASPESLSSRSYPKWEGPSFNDAKTASNRQKESFRNEWNDTLGKLESIKERMNDYRPIWISDDVPVAWQVDQFLHSYYYEKVREGPKHPYEEFHARNKKDPDRAVREALAWWKGLRDAPFEEDHMLYEHAPIIRKLLSEDHVLSMTKADLETLFFKTHATKNHVVKISAVDLGRPEARYLSIEERIPLFTDILLAARNKKGWDVRKLLHFVLYEGEVDRTWERLYHAGCDPDYRLPRYGLNSLSEVIGWARPEIYPPRNGRTSKALRALGYDVKVY